MIACVTALPCAINPHMLRRICAHLHCSIASSLALQPFILFVTRTVETLILFALDEQ